MCWNAKISMTTFLFSSFTLCLAYYNGYNPLLLVALFSYFAVQLNEYFIWIYLENKRLNYLFSMVTRFLILIQPLLTCLIIRQIAIRSIYLFIYFIYVLIAFIIFISSPSNKSADPYSIEYSTEVGYQGHLVWNWIEHYQILFPFYLFFMTALLIEKYYIIFIITFLTLIYSIYRYNHVKTFSSFWCWSANIISLYLIVRILFVDLLLCK